ncbi:hypothetical protein Lesp02_25850 [Lentzea sp. NBRC 105346]|uniref:hypothetical protein n=1 Tax=Lentzea sp. NBRC 105346 TaxID=3032205 RepID=UPI0025535D68|nr:hypothetical protein [Lentzea sp. NBRC 105346]GLZ30396.1 hypothetical protein Lesp02_25850 [Lentzea sp. NBRC 105346]
MTAPPGWHPHQQQQQQWGPPPPGYGYPPMPPKKSKAPVVIVVIAVLLLLGGGGTAAFFYFNAHKDGGRAHTGDKLPERCTTVSEATLAAVRTTNPNAKMSNEMNSNGRKFTSCSWTQTKGRDGEGLRSLSLRIEQGDETRQTYEMWERQAKSNGQGTIQTKELSGAGDQGAVILVLTDSAFTEVDMVVRKGDTVVGLDYIGWDVGIFSPTKPDLAEFEQNARKALDEVVAKI